MINLLAQIIEQTGDNCFHCHEVGTKEKPLVNGHLNPDRGGSSAEYYARMCQSCNCKMKKDFDMMDKANEQIEKNFNLTYERGKGRKKSCLNTDCLSSIEINRINKPITESYLLDHTRNGAILELEDTCHNIASICYSNNHTGSSQAVKRYIKDLSAGDDSKFILFFEEQLGKFYIKRREN